MPATGGPGHTSGVPFTTTNSKNRVRWKWELAIRYQIKNPNAKQSEVANHIGIDANTLSQWQASKDYQALSDQIITGILSHIDADLVEDINHQKLSLKRLVPVAIQNLADLALQSSNPSIKLKASQEILDREGNFAKVTRVGLPTEAQGGASNLDNAVAQALLESLRKAEAEKLAATKPSIESEPITNSMQ